MRLCKGSKLAASALGAGRSFSTSFSAERKVAVLGAAGVLYTRRTRCPPSDAIDLQAICIASGA